MKERIKKIIIVLLIMAGIVLVGALMHAYLPIWARCTVWGIGLIWLLYDVSKPEKKKTETYWYYSYIGSNNGQTYTGYGTQLSKSDEFDFAGYLDKLKDCHITMVKEISRKQYDKINELINARNEEQSND